jgi:hypothetical protein
MKQCQRIQKKWLKEEEEHQDVDAAPPAEQVEATEEQDKSKQQIQTLFVLDTIEDGLISCIIVRYNFLNDIITPEIL